MKKSILLSIISLLLIFLVWCDAIQLTQDPKNPKTNTGSNENLVVVDEEPIVNPENNFETNPDLEIPPSNQDNGDWWSAFDPNWGEAIPPELPISEPNPNPMPAEGEPWLIDCARSANWSIEKEVYITLNEISDPTSYENKKKEAMNLINQCYTVRISEEYEMEPGNVSTVGWSFKSKIIDSDSIFTVIPFYPIVDVYDYEGFIGTQTVTYISSSTAIDIFNYYQNIQPEGYKYMDFIQDQKLVYKNEVENKTITINLAPQWEYTLINFDLLQQFDVAE